ncbi:MAG: DNA/RNA nuclease SfsA [Thermodesulfobacteriota bacterium]
MDLPPLTTAALLKRRKRFLTDVRLEDGTELTAHCPNTGSMRGCSEPGRDIFLSRHDNPKRKYPYTWELIDMGSGLVGINTQRTNSIVREGIEGGHVPALSGYTTCRPEVATEAGTRLDFLWEGPEHLPLYMEVKNCTFVENGRAAFPDAVTMRGQKHLRELIRLQQQGAKTAVFFLIQRTDAAWFEAAWEIDHDYARLLHAAHAAGVAILAFDVHIDRSRITLANELPVTGIS